MEIRIGVIYTARELVIDVDDSPEQVTKTIDDAFGGSTSMLWLTDKKGKQRRRPDRQDRLRRGRE